MSIVLTIGGTDRTERVESNSLRIENILTRKRDVCRFNILDNPSASFTPTVGQEVIITFDPGTGSTRVFGGVIVELEQQVTAYKLIRWKVTCEDYTRLLDRRLVSDSFSNTTVDAVIAQLATTYFPTGFTTNNVDCPVTVATINFNYKTLVKCIEELAEKTGYDWYVDYNKDLHFFDSQTNPAPFNLSDTTGTYEYESLVIRRDNSQVRNRIVVRGGEYLGAQFTSEIEANGTDFIFPLGYRYSDFAASLTGNPLSVGIDYLDNPDSYHALYNFQEKIIRFKQADTPSAGAVMLVSGKPYLPVIVRLSSPSSISTFSVSEGGGGIYEHLILDKTITSKEEARQRARAELEIYATTLAEGEFTTYSHGLRAGQKISVVSATRGINENLIINRVIFQQFGSNSFNYQVSLISTKTFDLIDLLIRFSQDKNKEVTITDNDVVEVVVDKTDAMTIADALGTFSVTSMPYVWDTMEWNLATYSGV